MSNNFFSFSTEDVERITEAYSFSGFLTSSELRIAHETDTSMNLSMVLEDGSRGEIQQEQLEEPQAHSSLLEPAEGSTEPAKANEPAKADEVDPEADEAKIKKRRIRRRLSRERVKLTKKFSELSTGQDGQGNSGSEASGSGTGGAKSKPVGLEPVERCGRYSPTAQTQPSGTSEPAKAGEVDPEGVEAKLKKRQNRRHLSRERAKVTKKFSKLSTGQDGQGNSGSGTGGAKSKPVGLEPVKRRGRYSPTAKTHPSESAEPAEKRGRSSPGEGTEPKRQKQKDIPPSRLSFFGSY